MAGLKLCKIDGCDKRVHSGGMCAVHYNRMLRHGDPLAGRTPDGELTRYLTDVVLPYRGDECLKWPYSLDGHGYGVIRNRRYRGFVHRIVCQETNGPPPTSAYEAAHSCGNGHLSCVTPRHLSWKTHRENISDMVDHGTRAFGEQCGSSKLTETQVREIISMRGTMTHRKIAAKFGLSQSHVTRILNGKMWGHLG